MKDLHEKYVNVIYDKQLNALHVEFLGFISFEDFKKVLNYEFEMIRFYKIDKCLIDLRLIPVYASGSPEYVRDVWFPTVKKEGVKYVAFVIPEAALGKMSMNKAHADADEKNHMQVNHFSDLTKAIDWLKSFLK